MPREGKTGLNLATPIRVIDYRWDDEKKTS